MVEVERGVLDTFEVGIGDLRNGKFEVQQNNNTYYFEVINNIVITVSLQSLKELNVSGTVINFNNLKDFLKRENPLVDGDFYIFPEMQLSLYPDFKNNEFLQVLVYDKSLEDLYIKGYPKYSSLNTALLDIPDILVFEPFKSLGEFEFGVSKENFRESLNLTTDITLGVKGKEIISVAPFSFRFYSNKLMELFLNCPKSEDLKILLNINDIGVLRELIKKETVIERKAYIVFPNLGLTVGKSLEDKEFFFYDKYLLQFWENINRPVTSW